MDKITHPYSANAAILTVITNESGAIYVALPDIICQSVRFFNETATSLRIGNTNVAAGLDYIILPSGRAEDIHVRQNANELFVKRNDDSNTQVTVRFQVKGSK